MPNPSPRKYLYFLFLLIIHFHLSSLLLSPIKPFLRRTHPPTTLRKMNCDANYDQSSVLKTASDEMRTVGPVACPKPRRPDRWSVSIADQSRPNTYFRNTQVDFSAFGVGSGLLDTIMAEGGYGNGKYGGQVASSPPFFYGSPPTRSSNPVVRDSIFGSEEVKPPLLSSFKSSSPLLSPSSCKSGGARMKIGQKAAAVRIEGFDCLGGDRQNCNISAVA